MKRVLVVELFALKAVVFVDRLRISFKKGQQVKFISHLDLLRTFVRAIRRADIPVKYSEGFNPHAQLTFALPLAVGVTSECEVLDITLEKPVDIIETVKNLEKALPPGLEIVQAQITPSKMPEYTKAAYTVVVENSTDFDQNIKDEIMQSMRSGDIIVEKKTKKKTTMVNIIEHIFEFEIVKAEGNVITFNMTLSVGNEFTLKPELVLKGLESIISEFRTSDVDINRREIFV